MWNTLTSKVEQIFLILLQPKSRKIIILENLHNKNNNVQLNI